MYTDYSSECLPLLLAHRSSHPPGTSFWSDKSAAAAVFLACMDEVVFTPCSKARRYLPPIPTRLLCGVSCSQPPRLPARAAHLVAVGVLLLVLLDQPVLDGGGRLAGGGGLLALDLDGHALVLLQRGGEVGLLRGLGGLGLVEGQDLALGVVGLECRCFVGLEFFQVKFLDKVGCEDAVVLISMHFEDGIKCSVGRGDRQDVLEERAMSEQVNKGGRKNRRLETRKACDAR